MDDFRLLYAKKRLLYLLQEEMEAQEVIFNTLKIEDKSVSTEYEELFRQKDALIAIEAKRLVDLLIKGEKGMKPINEKATQKFKEVVMSVQEQLADLADYFEEDMDVDVNFVNWGHVYTAKDIFYMLEEIKAFAGLSDAE
jgi:hypothetical protein